MVRVERSDAPKRTVEFHLLCASADGDAQDAGFWRPWALVTPVWALVLAGPAWLLRQRLRRRWLARVKLSPNEKATMTKRPEHLT